MKTELEQAKRRCSNYMWMINNFIAYYGAAYIWGLPVSVKGTYAYIKTRW